MSKLCSNIAFFVPVILFSWGASANTQNIQQERFLDDLAAAMEMANIDADTMDMILQDTENALNSPNSISGQLLLAKMDKDLDLTQGSVDYGIFSAIGSFSSSLLSIGKKVPFLPSIIGSLMKSVSSLELVVTSENIDVVEKIVKATIKYAPEIKAVQDVVISLINAYRVLSSTAETTSGEGRESLEESAETIRQAVIAKLAEMEGGDTSKIEQLTANIEAATEEKKKD